ncbi:MAG: hypothetical protein PHD72_01535 [Patescibacteria group bacterium]|nr:hypothetical protein [Patescibacteria group bacterium]
MTNHGTVPQNQFEEFLAALIVALPQMTPEQMQKFIRLSTKTKRKKLRELFGTTDTEVWREEWTKFYLEVFNLAVDLTNVVLPTEVEEFAWLTVLAKELGDTPLNTAMVAARKLFKGKVWQYYDDLDKDVTVNDRDLKNGSYAIRIRARVEADEENKGLSANQIAERKLVTMTLLERIVLELFYFWKTGKHLDIQNVTLCSGSRSSDGRVPRCDLFGAGHFFVDDCRPGCARVYLRARVAVL